MCEYEVQWLSDRVLDSRPNGRMYEPPCGPWARNIYPSLVLVQPRKTGSYITERLLMGRKESNQINVWTITMQSLNVKEWKLLELQITQTRRPYAFRMEKCPSPTPVKKRKYLSNVHKIRGAHLQCVYNHYAKFECKGMKTGGVTDFTNQTPSKHFWTENV